MNAAGECALVQILLDDAPLTALVADRIWWDDREPDPPRPAIALRLLSAPVVGQLADLSQLTNPLVEMACYSGSRRGAAELLDAAAAALVPYLNRTAMTVGSPAIAVRFGSIRLIDMQQSPSPREGVYRKVGLFSVWQEG